MDSYETQLSQTGMFTFRLPADPGARWYPTAGEGMVGQRPKLNGFPCGRGEIVAAEVVDDGAAIDLTIVPYEPEGG